MKKPVFKRYLHVLVCLLIAGNVSQGVVVCFGDNGHVAVEAAFHENHCGGHAGHSGPKQLTLKHIHGQDEDCHPCVDVPIPVDAAKNSCYSQFQNHALFIPSLATQVRVDVSLSAFTFASDHRADSPYFIGLRTVIILC